MHSKTCSKCKHSEYDERYPDTIPSIYKCHNDKSENYGTVAWFDTCDLFEEE